MNKCVEFIEEDSFVENQQVSKKQPKKGFIYSSLRKLGIQGILADVLLVLCVILLLAIAAFNMFQAQQPDQYNGLLISETKLS